MRLSSDPFVSGSRTLTAVSVKHPCSIELGSKMSRNGLSEDSINLRWAMLRRSFVCDLRKDRVNFPTRSREQVDVLLCAVGVKPIFRNGGAPAAPQERRYGHVAPRTDAENDRHSRAGLPLDIRDI